MEKCLKKYVYYKNYKNFSMSRKQCLTEQNYTFKLIWICEKIVNTKYQCSKSNIFNVIIRNLYYLVRIIQSYFNDVIN